MRKVLIVSDLSGKECRDHVEISIKREGYDIKIADTLYVGDVHLDLDEEEVSSVLSSIKYVKKERPPFGPAAMSPFGVPGKENVAIAEAPIFFSIERGKQDADRSP